MKKVTNTANTPRPEWLFGLNPNAIEAQEAAGQVELKESSQLPIRCNYPRDIDIKKQYETMGITVIEKSKSDDIFFDVELPEGWELKPTDHSMWNELIDSKGRKRAMIFYKAAFYDRSSHIDFERKINFRVDRLAFLNNDYTSENGEYKGYKTPFVGRVTDFDGTVLFETEHIKCDVEYEENERGKYYSDKYKRNSDIAERKLRDDCLKYLADNYPKYEDINAYWN